MITATMFCAERARKPKLLLYGLFIAVFCGCASPQKAVDPNATNLKSTIRDEYTLSPAWQNAIENSKNSEWIAEYNRDYKTHEWSSSWDRNSAKYFVERINKLAETLTPQEFSDLEVNCHFSFFADWVVEGFSVNEAKLFCSAWEMGNVSENIARAKMWKDAGFTAEETIGYRELGDSEKAKKFKELGLSPAEAAVGLKLISNMQTISGSPSIDPKDLSKYDYAFQPYYIYAKDRETLEQFLLAMFRYNDDISLLKTIQKGDLLYQKAPSQVSIKSLDWFKCPWGNMRIVKFQDIQTKQDYWTIIYSLR